MQDTSARMDDETRSSRANRIAVLGATITGNKGAESMLRSVVGNLPRFIGPCTFDVLSIYPREDASANKNPAVNVVPCKPRHILLPMFPLAVLAGLFRLLRLPAGWLCRFPALRSMKEADVVLDLSGISFVDGRGPAILGYNFLTMLIPILLGAKVVKCSQALGPFRGALNRLLARAVLPRLSAVCARGGITEHNLKGLGLENVAQCADLAFTMPVDEESGRKAEQILSAQGPGAGFVGFVPSMVVDNYCRRAGIVYSGVMASFIDRIFESSGMRVVLFPHAARARARADRMNDLSLCQSIHEKVRSRAGCTLIDEILTAPELRALIARCDLLVTSRFHAMISALVSAVPVMVIGWSHKYSEVTDVFGLQDFVIGYDDLSVETACGVFGKLLSARKEVADAMTSAIPKVSESSLRNFEVIRRAIRPERAEN